MIFSNRSILLYCCGLFASLFCSVAVTAESPDIAALLQRLSGTLLSYTWLMDTGFSASDVMAQLLDSVADTEGATELFTCDGRACGRAVQWANRVFKQRILFGREDLQRYRVYGFEGTPQARLLIYSAERTADRQYLHVEWLVISP